MANGFNKEEVVAFENLLEGFNDALVLSKNVSVFSSDQQVMERANDTLWRPQPYIAQSIASTPGVSIAGSYQTMTQLSVPATIGFSRTVPWTMNAKELRDALQEGRLTTSAHQKLASDINLAIMNVAANLGSLVVDIGAAAGSYDDVALCDSIMNEQGVPNYDRFLALSSRDYNGLAGNIAGAAAAATRSFSGNKSNTAFERSYVGMVAGFDTFKLDYAKRIGAAAGGATVISTLAGAGNYYTPKATSTAVTGETANVDNRFQTITVDNTGGIVAGDAFTISGVEAVHHITKESTGQLKTFRVVSVPAGGTTLVITPPIISAQGATDAEKQYQNVKVTANAGATFTWLNVNAANINPFWQKDALEILPGRYAVDPSAGASIMRATTDQGIEVVLQKMYDIDSMTYKFRVDTLYGVVNKQPEMSGILIFGQ